MESTGAMDEPERPRVAGIVQYFLGQRRDRGQADGVPAAIAAVDRCETIDPIGIVLCR